MRTTPLKILASLALALLAPPVLQAQTSQAPAGAMTARVIVKFKADSAMLRQLALPDDREGTAYVCVGTVCSAPVAHPEDLYGAVEDALAAPAY